MFELALEYAQKVADLGPIYHDQDRNEVPELWVVHDEAYRRLWEAQQRYDGMQETVEKREQDLVIQLERFQEAERKAQSASLDEECTKHVNAIVSKSWPHQITRYEVSDWYNDDCTVASYYNGELQG